MSSGQSVAQSAGARSAPADAGLVYNSTKATRHEWIKLDRHASRCRRMRRKVDHAARVLDFREQPMRRRKLFVTLTYRDAGGWKPQHIRSFMRCLRTWLDRRGGHLSCVWVAELQKRGAVHYHLCIWLPRHLSMPKPDKRGWWKHGSTNVQTARSPIGYLMKYASKGSEAKFPRRCRIHGACGLDEQSAREVRYFCAPCYVRDALSGLADIRKVVGGWADKLTGNFFRSPWEVYHPAGGALWAIRKLEALPC